MLNTYSPRSRDDLLALLPPRHVADRLVMRYFSSHSASQRTIAFQAIPYQSLTFC